MAARRPARHRAPLSAIAARGRRGLHLCSPPFDGVRAAVLGRYPDSLGGAFIGVLYGILLQLVVLTWIVDGMQDVDTLHSAAPAWSWWVAHLVFGFVVGIVGSAVLRRASRRGDLMSAEV